MNPNLVGALWILASGLAGTIMSLGIRSLAGEVHSTQIVYIRCMVGLAIVLPVVWYTGFTSLRTTRWRLHLARGIMAIVGINCGFYSLTVLPLITATTLFFSVPLFVTILAVLILGETVGWRRWTATSMGFAGVMIVLKPFDQAFDPNMLFAIASSLTFAFALVLNRKLSDTESPTTMIFYFSVIAGIGSLPPALPSWIWPELSQWWMLLFIGVIATIRSYFDIKGFAIGDASFIAPFQYFRLLMIAVGAYIVFGEVPESRAMLGAAVIIFSTLYITMRELQLGRKKPVGGL